MFEQKQWVIALPFVRGGPENQRSTRIFVPLTHANGFDTFIIVAFLLFADVAFERMVD